MNISFLLFLSLFFLVWGWGVGSLFVSFKWTTKSVSKTTSSYPQMVSSIWVAASHKSNGTLKLLLSTKVYFFEIRTKKFYLRLFLKLETKIQYTNFESLLKLFLRIWASNWSPLSKAFSTIIFQSIIFYQVKPFYDASDI